MYSSNNCFFKLCMRIWDFMTPSSSMNLRILKSNKDEKAYRKWNQTTAQVSTCPSVNFSNRKKKKSHWKWVLVAELCPILATPWTVAYQAALSMEFSRQKSWSGCDLSLLQGIFPTQVSCIAGKFFTIWATRESQSFAKFLS